MKFLRNTRFVMSRLSPEEYEAILDLSKARPAAQPTSQQPPLEPGLSHVDVQRMLVKLGKEFGFKVWVSGDSRGKVLAGTDDVDCPKQLPILGLNQQTMRLIQAIDILWLRRNSIEAAFEVEHTTSIYSGLLRMSDLVALQPNLSITLYLVAPDSRADKVRREVNRPTFQRLEPPLVKQVYLLRYSKLQAFANKTKDLVGYVKPSLINKYRESLAEPE